MIRFVDNVTFLNSVLTQSQLHSFKMICHKMHRRTILRPFPTFFNDKFIKVVDISNLCYI